MAIRMSGMISGMDTESLVSQLVEAKGTKVKKAKKDQMRANWKQDAWKDLNTKLKNLQSKFVSNMRFASSYAKKTTKVSDPTKASVITGDGSVNSVQSLEIEELAKTAYLTGGELAKTDDAGNLIKGADGKLVKGDYTAMTNLSELGITEGTFKIGTANITVGSGEGDCKTISDVLTKLKDAGLNASFDSNNQRFFISAKESGAKNEFEVEAVDEEGKKALAKLGLMTKEQLGATGLSEEDFNAGTKVKAQDAKIKLNGAEFTNSTNVFDINGLTITALAKTDKDSPITLTTETDTDGIYDMVKNFLKEYNTVINEMDKLYNAASASGYDPLLSEEKEAMSETEVTEYEKKIKDSLLRNDSNLSDLSSMLKNAMSSGFDVNGKKMYLSDFGIGTLGYFTSADNEKNAYHIDGDPDDSSTSGNVDKLKSMIASSPDTVISFFTQMAQNLYTKMSDQSKSVDGYRSFGSFYDDKKMTADYKDYTSKIADLEQKLNDYEDKWYSKFAKMEAAMAKMQSKTNALAGLIGGGS